MYHKKMNTNIYNNNNNNSLKRHHQKTKVVALRNQIQHNDMNHNDNQENQNPNSYQKSKSQSSKLNHQQKVSSSNENNPRRKIFQQMNGQVRSANSSKLSSKIQENVNVVNNENKSRKVQQQKVKQPQQQRNDSFGRRAMVGMGLATAANALFFSRAVAASPSKNSNGSNSIVLKVIPLEGKGDKYGDKESQESLEATQNEIARLKSNTAVSSKERQYELFKKGLDLTNNYAYEEASLVYTSIIDSYQMDDPNDFLNDSKILPSERLVLARAYSNRGNCFSELGRLKEALLDYSMALNLAPDVTQYYVNRALTYEDMGDALLQKNKVTLSKQLYENAIADYTHAIVSDPSNARLYVNLGDVFTRLEKHTEALDSYRKSLTLQPQNPSIFAKVALM